MSPSIEGYYPEHSWNRELQPGGYTVTGGVGGISFSWEELLRGAMELEGLADELRRLEAELEDIARRLNSLRFAFEMGPEASAVQFTVMEAGLQAGVRGHRFQELADKVSSAFNAYVAKENSLLIQLRKIEVSTKPGYDVMGNRTLMPSVTEVDAPFHWGDDGAGFFTGAARLVGLLEERPITAELIPEKDGDRTVGDYDGSLSGLIGRTGDLEWVNGEAAEGVVEVSRIAVDGAPDRYAVTVPGTQDFSPVASDNPLDMTGNMAALTGSPHMAKAVMEALGSAGATPGSAIMITGHSGGGIHARAIAADPAFLAEYDPRFVVTAGSPVGDIPLPPQAQGLNLQQHDDKVVDSDLRLAPDTVNNTTVTFQTPPVVGPTGDEVSGHGVYNYASKAELLEDSEHPSVKPAIAGIAGFAPAGAVVSAYKFKLERQPAPPRVSHGPAQRSRKFGR